MNKNNNNFDLMHLSNLLEQFVQNTPKLLNSTLLTTSLGGQLERLNELSDLPFEVAIVGQMRSGKSSLINAIIGEDLAPVGVNETTATINRFRYAPKNESKNFRVHWKEKPPQDYPLENRDLWCGKSEMAKKTKFIEFFSQADILKSIYIVDTPGTRSVIEDHDRNIDEFMAQKHERETLLYGGKADAIIYMLGPVARETDEVFLEKFQGQTRRTGSSPFNSIAVLHKWETVDSENPVLAATQKAKLIYDQLKDQISAVIPVSAPLIKVVEKQPEVFWIKLADTIKKLSPRQQRTITIVNDENLKVNNPELYEVFRQGEIPWASFRAIYFIAKQNDFPSGRILCQIVRNAAGKERLLKILNDRFIQRTNMVKSFTRLNRSMAICTEARITLRNKIRKLEEDEKDSTKAYKELSVLYESGFQQLKFAMDVMEKNSHQLQTEKKIYTDTLLRLDSQTHELQCHFEDVDHDVQQMRVLDDNSGNLSNDELLEFRTVLGCYGQSAMQRLDFYRQFDGELLSIVEQKIDHWSFKKETIIGPLSSVLYQIVNRLEALADYLEEYQIKL